MGEDTTGAETSGKLVEEEQEMPGEESGRKEGCFRKSRVPAANRGQSAGGDRQLAPGPRL